MAHFKEKKAGRSRRGQSPAQDSLSGNKDSAKAERLPAPRLHGTACRKKAPARMRTIWPCRRPRKPGPLAIARSFCTSPCGRHGNGRWARPVWQCQRGSWWFRRHRAGLRRLPYGRCNGHRRKHHICRSFPENRRWDTQAWLTSQGWSDTVRQ